MGSNCPQSLFETKTLMKLLFPRDNEVINGKLTHQNYFIGVFH